MIEAFLSWSPGLTGMLVLDIRRRTLRDKILGVRLVSRLDWGWAMAEVVVVEPGLTELLAVPPLDRLLYHGLHVVASTMSGTLSSLWPILTLLLAWGTRVRPVRDYGSCTRAEAGLDWSSIVVELAKLLFEFADLLDNDGERHFVYVAGSSFQFAQSLGGLAIGRLQNIHSPI